MPVTPGQPRTSGTLAPGKVSGLPTLGRARSGSSASQPSSIPVGEPFTPGMSRAFSDAVKANDPAQYRYALGRTSEVNISSSLSPESVTFLAQSNIGPITGRPCSSASSSSHAGTTPVPPRYPTSGRPKTPNGARPASRQSDAITRSISRHGRDFEVGDNVRVESLGFEGTLRYVGVIGGKMGEWAGVELSGGFTGMGKNDGSVDGYVHPEVVYNFGDARAFHSTHFASSVGLPALASLPAFALSVWNTNVPRT